MAAGVTGAGAPNPGAVNPGAVNPGAPKPGAPKPGAVNPGAPRPSAPQPGPPEEGPTEGLCLVTGASGFVGSHLVERLVDRGYRVRLLLRKSSKLRWVRGLPVELTYGDIRDKASIAGACHGVQNVFHFGALTTARNEAEFFAANEEGTKNLAEALAEHGEAGGFVVYCSSLAAGGPGIATASHTQPVRIERDPDLPITPYGRSKLGGERALFEIAKATARFRAVALRPSVVYGPRDEALLQFFKLVKMGLLPMGGPEGARMAMLYVLDLVDAAVAAAERDVSGVYYLCDGEAHTWQDIGRLSAELMDASPKEVRVPVPMARMVAWAAECVGQVTGRAPMLTRWKVREMQQAHWVCSPDKARRELGFQSKVAIELGLESTLSWYRENGWL
ncbi:MAG: NAD-dependent epimerase/dehydratase family protein [Candidatus Eisenbacteria bacterium]